jgi:hypothetical protein
LGNTIRDTVTFNKNVADVEKEARFERARREISQREKDREREKQKRERERQKDKERRLKDQQKDSYVLSFFHFCSSRIFELKHLLYLFSKSFFSHIFASRSERKRMEHKRSDSDDAEHKHSSKHRKDSDSKNHKRSQKQQEEDADEEPDRNERKKRKTFKEHNELEKKSVREESEDTKEQEKDEKESEDEGEEDTERMIGPALPKNDNVFLLKKKVKGRGTIGSNRLDQYFASISAEEASSFDRKDPSSSSSSSSSSSFISSPRSSSPPRKVTAVQPKLSPKDIEMMRRRAKEMKERKMEQKDSDPDEI